MKTHDVGPIFVQFVRLKRGTAFLHTATTFEIVEPFRRSQSIIVHCWPGRGLVVGFWRRTGWTEEEALRAATQAEDFDPLDENGHLEPRFYRESLEPTSALTERESA
jgi:hypothetical protein